jgi:hypothetical protein
MVVCRTQSSKVSKSFKPRCNLNSHSVSHSSQSLSSTASQSAYKLSMRESDRTPSNGSSSPASSQTCVELSSSIHKDKASDKSSHVLDFFSSPSTVHAIPSSPPQEPKMSTILFQETKMRSPVRSPIKARFQPYLKSRATAAATAEFAMKSLRGQTAPELNPEGALMASYGHCGQCGLIDS